MTRFRTASTACTVLCLSALLCAVGCGRRQLSGQYLAKFSDGLWWLEIVRTPDGHVTGQLLSMKIGKDGKIEQNTTQLTGASDGSNVVLSTSSFLGLFGATLSGDLQGNQLTLTGPQASTIILTRSSRADFQREQSSIVKRTQEFLAEKEAQEQKEADEEAREQQREQAQEEEQKFISEVDRTIHGMSNFVADADIHVSRFQSAEAYLRSTTQKISGYVNSERQLAGNPAAAVRRGQLLVAANQAAIKTDQLRIAIQSFESSLAQNVQPVTKELMGLEQTCRIEITPGTSAPESNARNAACTRLSNADRPYRQKIDAVGKGLSHLKQVYAREREAQLKLLRTAQQFQ